MIGLRGAVALCLILFLAACGRIVPEGTGAPQPLPVPPAPVVPSPPPPSANNALAAGVATGPQVRFLVPAGQSAERALTAFKISCPVAMRRDDPTGLTMASDWVEPCTVAQDVPRGGAAAFFDRYFSAVQVGDGAAFATGYYEPEIAAARSRSGAYSWPIYGVPSDLQTRSGPDGAQVYRVVNGQEQPYPDRAAIEDGALAGQGLEIAYARDLVDLFFLQVQGSGVLRQPDGSAMRVGYAGNNGYPYVSIGRLMLDRGLLPPGQATAEGIASWLRANPEQARSIMQENRRYIFFRPLEGSAPLGSLGLPVTPRATVAVDPAFVPRGAPVILNLEHDVADGVWVAQDSGGAIRGANRFDTFWGAGDEAYAVASGMSSRGTAWILIPTPAALRLSRQP